MWFVAEAAAGPALGSMDGGIEMTPPPPARCAVPQRGDDACAIAAAAVQQLQRQIPLAARSTPPSTRVGRELAALAADISPGVLQKKSGLAKQLGRAHQAMARQVLGSWRAVACNGWREHCWEVEVRQLLIAKDAEHARVLGAETARRVAAEQQQLATEQRLVQVEECLRQLQQKMTNAAAIVSGAAAEAQNTADERVKLLREGSEGVYPTPLQFLAARKAWQANEARSAKLQRQQQKQQHQHQQKQNYTGEDVAVATADAPTEPDRGGISPSMPPHVVTAGTPPRSSKISMAPHQSTPVARAGQGRKKQ